MGYYFGQGIANLLLSLTGLPFGLGCALVSAFQPILVLFGAHTVLAAPMISAIDTLGYDALIRPAFIMASFGDFGAIMAVMLKCKHKDLKSLAGGCAVTSFLGTNELSMYSVRLPLGTPFITSILGAAVGGMVSGLLGARAYAMGKNGVFGWLVFQDTMPQIIIVSAVAAAVAFALTWIIGFDEDKVVK